MNDETIFASDIKSASEPSGRHPGLVILHDWYGPDHHSRSCAEKLQAQGYLTYGPDLFAGMEASASDDTARASFTAGLSDPQITAAAMAAVDKLAAHPNIDPDRIGLVGWGWGGTCSLLAAAHDRRVGAAFCA